jgi:hypothetical protein
VTKVGVGGGETTCRREEGAGVGVGALQTHRVVPAGVQQAHSQDHIPPGAICVEDHTCTHTASRAVMDERVTRGGGGEGGVVGAPTCGHPGVPKAVPEQQDVGPTRHLLAEG